MNTTNQVILEKLQWVYRFQDDLIAFECYNMFEKKYLKYTQKK